VEILSPGTRDRDLIFKKDIYQQQRVPWYLIVDPENNTLQPLRLDDSGCYQCVAHDGILVVDICKECLLAVHVGQLFPS
jgi:Uma2 family endonuclease